MEDGYNPVGGLIMSHDEALRACYWHLFEDPTVSRRLEEGYIAAYGDHLGPAVFASMKPLRESRRLAMRRQLDTERVRHDLMVDC